MLTFEEFFKKETGLDEWGIEVELLWHVTKRHSGVAAKYLDYAIKEKFKELKEST